MFARLDSQYESCRGFKKDFRDIGLSCGGMELPLSEREETTHG